MPVPAAAGGRAAPRLSVTTQPQHQQDGCKCEQNAAAQALRVVLLGHDPATGRRQCRTFTVRGTKKEAEAAAAAQVAAITGGTFVDPSEETVEEFLHRWLRDYVEPSLALRTRRRYREIVEYDLVPFIGKVPLQKLRPAQVIALEQRLRASGNRRTGAGLGPAAVQKVHSVLHRAMAHAVRWQALAVNRSARSTVPRYPGWRCRC